MLPFWKDAINASSYKDCLSNAFLAIMNYPLPRSFICRKFKLLGTCIEAPVEVCFKLYYFAVALTQNSDDRTYLYSHCVMLYEDSSFKQFRQKYAEAYAEAKPFYKKHSRSSYELFGGEAKSDARKAKLSKSMSALDEEVYKRRGQSISKSMKAYWGNKKRKETLDE